MYINLKVFDIIHNKYVFDYVNLNYTNISCQLRLSVLFSLFLCTTRETKLLGHAQSVLSFRVLVEELQRLF